MSDAWLLYGATGYTGRLILAEALALGLRPILGGRDERRLATLAASHGLRYRATPLDDPGGLAASLDDIRVVPHAAGPFSTTSRPMVDACLDAGVHYLDITGEVLVLEAIADRHAEAARRGVMLMPAVGFDVVPSDCLAAHVARRLPHARRLALGISGLTLATRGSARTFVELPASGPRVRRDGMLVSVTPGTRERPFDYGAGPRPSTCVSWGDLTTAYYTTGIPDIEVYFETTPALGAGMASARAFGWLLATPPWQAFLKASAALVPEGPTAAERAATPMTIVAEAEDAAGRRVGHGFARRRPTRSRRLGGGRRPARARGRRRAGVPDAGSPFRTRLRARPPRRDPRRPGPAALIFLPPSDADSGKRVSRE